MIDYSPTFLKEAKQLSKKYQHFKIDLKVAIGQIKDNDLGTPIGKGLYKKRVKNSSSKVGKSGGFRMIIYQIQHDKITLISVYSKTQKSNISSSELQAILGSL